jgi:hypothetical protein
MRETIIPMKVQRGMVVETTISGRVVRFFVDNPRDEIQKNHAEGRFYETEELDIIQRHFIPGTTFIDVGSNVGNHALYVGLYLRPVEVIVFEPFPRARDILEINVALNSLGNICLDFLGFALSDRVSEINMASREFNLGATPCHLSV